MRHLLIVSHADLADSIKRTSEMIVGKNDLSITTIMMTPEKSPEAFKNEVNNIVSKDINGEYLILADLQGASPCSISCLACRNIDFRVLTGINLGMLLEVVLNFNDGDLDELCDRALVAGRDSIQKIKLN